MTTKRRKRHTPEQIVKKLRNADALQQHSGMTYPNFHMHWYRKLKSPSLVETDIPIVVAGLQCCGTFQQFLQPWFLRESCGNVTRVAVVNLCSKVQNVREGQRPLHHIDSYVSRRTSTAD